MQLRLTRRHRIVVAEGRGQARVLEGATGGASGSCMAVMAAAMKRRTRAPPHHGRAIPAEDPNLSVLTF